MAILRPTINVIVTMQFQTKLSIDYLLTGIAQQLLNFSSIFKTRRHNTFSHTCFCRLEKTDREWNWIFSIRIRFYCTISLAPYRKNPEKISLTSSNRQLVFRCMTKMLLLSGFEWMLLLCSNKINNIEIGFAHASTTATRIHTVHPWMVTVSINSVCFRFAFPNTLKHREKSIEIDCVRIERRVRIV